MKVRNKQTTGVKDATMKGARTCCPRITANLAVPEVSMLAFICSSSGLAAMQPKSPSLVLVLKRITKLAGAVGQTLEKSGSSDVTT